MYPSLVDRLVEFNPHAIWLYLSFFALIPLAFLLTPIDHIKWLSSAMQLTAFGAGAMYLLYPTTMAYPVDQGVTVSSKVLAILSSFDSKQNCLPSLHMALMVLAVWGINESGRTLITNFTLLWVVAIAFSILQLRRHLFIDVVSGASLALFAGWLAKKFNPIVQSETERGLR